MKSVTSPSTPHQSTDQCNQSSTLETPISFYQAYSSRIAPWLLSRIQHIGFTHPTPVQKSTLDLALPSVQGALGHDVVVHAQTGSGKTLAYLLPAITTVDPSRSCTQAMIVVPTQELGMQVYKLLRRLTSAYGHAKSEIVNESLERDDAIIEYLSCTDAPDEKHKTQLQPPASTTDDRPAFPVLPMLNQANLRRQKLQLRQAAPRIIVGNPHRIAELVNSGRLRLDLLKVLVVDEFDACLLDTSTTNALQTILSVRGRESPRQTILASATVPQHRHFLRQCVRQLWTRANIKHVWIEEMSGEKVPPSLTHWYALCHGRKKLAALRALLARANSELLHSQKNAFLLRAMVFVMATRKIDDIVLALNETLEMQYDMPGAQLVVGISNNSSLMDRREALKRFRNGEARVLIGTDVAARGLDVPDITHIFHFDLPTDPDSYLHRAGRAGRQGRAGSSIVLISPGEQFVLSRTSNALGIEFCRIGR